MPLSNISTLKYSHARKFKRNLTTNCFSFFKLFGFRFFNNTDNRESSSETEA